jgi:hypothetical protein
MGPLLNWAAGALVAVAIVVGVLLWRPLRAAWKRAEFDRARRDFRGQRERLEAKFFQLAAASGRPRGLRWTDCEFDDEVTYARDRATGKLQALVAVTIAFEAIEGGGMEDVQAVGNLRAATSVFHFDGSQWRTQGRAIFNLNPHEAITYYRDTLVRVGAGGSQTAG